MITIVSGVKRSGTSMMMQILQAGGIPLLYDTTTVCDANPYGFFEWAAGREYNTHPDWPQIVEGKAVKFFLRRAQMLSPDLDCRVVIMVRDPLEIAKSSNLFRSLPVDQDLENETIRMAEKLAAIRAAFPAFPVLEIPYSEIVQAPDVWLNAIIDFLSLDPANIVAMRAVIKPELYRNKS
jgi:hypothetical protein